MSVNLDTEFLVYIPPSCQEIPARKEPPCQEMHRRGNLESAPRPFRIYNSRAPTVKPFKVKEHFEIFRLGHKNQHVERNVIFSFTNVLLYTILFISACLCCNQIYAILNKLAHLSFYLMLWNSLSFEI